MNTEKEINETQRPITLREKIGLLPHHEFLSKRARGIVKQAKMGDLDRLSGAQLHEHITQRQMGRTTEMLIRAVEAAAQGNDVLIKAHPATQQTMRETASEWCRICGIDQRRILQHAPAHGEMGRHLNLLVFVDHYISVDG